LLTYSDTKRKTLQVKRKSNVTKCNDMNIECYTEVNDKSMLMGGVLRKEEALYTNLQNMQQAYEMNFELAGK